MKGKYAPIVAAVLLIGSAMPSLAQLPPCNMGKAVHQPGDNQYNVNTQMERHGTNYIDRTGPGSSVMVQHGSGGGGGGGGGPMPGMSMAVNAMTLMGSNAPKVDISLEPISADEPVPPPGFPPLPERLQLPIAQTASSWNPSRGGSGGGGGGGPQIQGMHQHYAHVAPGAYMNQGNGGGGGGGYSGPSPDEAVPGASGGSPPIAGAMPAQQQPPSHYYKCNTAPTPVPQRNMGMGDTFNASNGPSAPHYSGASSRDLRALGKAPGLDDKADATAAPEAPQAAIVNQSTTQDLSLPDDEFVSRYGLKDTPGKRAANYAGRILRQGVYTGVSRVYSLIP